MILGGLGALGFGALGGYLFYQKKHPVDVESGQVSNIRDWQSVYPTMVEHIQEISKAQTEQLKKDFEATLREEQEKERKDCDEKIDGEIGKIKKEFQEKVNQLQNQATKARKSSEENQNIIKQAMSQCKDGCFANIEQRS